LDHVPTNLSAFIRLLRSGRNVLIPGCGEDYRTIDAFRLAGHQVTAIDFSPVAIERTNKALTEFGSRVILGDFFSYELQPAPFDIVYERTFLCSLPPRLWKDYAARMAQLLRPGGTLAGFFFYGKQSDPPPYPLNESRASELFGPHFELVKSELVSDSVSIFAGKEKWQEWQRRSNQQ
jgi:cyclopropane fatty-acyl-phospholipid synthase-like methyltransferase